MESSHFHLNIMSQDSSNFQSKETNKASFRDSLTSTKERKGWEVINAMIENKAVDLNGLIENPVTGDKESPLELAIRFGNYKIAFFLLNQGANPLVKNSGNQTAFFYLKAAYNPTQGMLLYREMISKSSFSAKEIWNMRDCRNQTPLHTVVNFLTAEWLDELKDEIDLNVKDKNGQTPLYFALGSPNIVKALIQRGSEVNCVDEFGKTPLSHVFFEAMRTSDFENYYVSAIFLIEAGAKVDETSLNAAYSHRGNMIPKDLALILLDKGTFTQNSVSKLALALEMGLLDEAIDLLKKGENPNWFHSQLMAGLSLLDIAALNQSILNFLFLLEYGATYDPKSQIFDPLRQGLASIYLKNYSSSEERRQAIHAFLTDPKGKVFQIWPLQKDYIGLCDYFNIPEHQRCRLPNFYSESEQDSVTDELSTNLKIIKSQKTSACICILL